MTAPVLLASTSRYRAELLGRLGLPFDQQSPVCDETPLPDEIPSELVARLARLKAESIHDAGSDRITIGSDQVAHHAGVILGKPGDHAAATKQLQTIAGETVHFYTGLHVLRGNQARHCIVTTEVVFKALANSQIERYLLKDQPYDCACSFKSESMGSAIVETMASDDPSALIGLPLIKLAGFINDLGLELP